MNKYTVKLDSKQFTDAINELKFFVQVSNEFLKIITAFIDNIDDRSDLAKIENGVAGGANEIIVVLKPSDRLSDFIIALRTLNSEAVFANS